jgi:hypothetical protein
MTAFLTRALGAAFLVALVGCASPEPVPQSTAAVPPGTPVVTTVPAVTAPQSRPRPSLRCRSCR